MWPTRRDFVAELGTRTIFPRFMAQHPRAGNRRSLSRHRNRGLLQSESMMFRIGDAHNCLLVSIAYYYLRRFLDLGVSLSTGCRPIKLSQAEKDAKRKAKARERKKLQRAVVLRFNPTWNSAPTWNRWDSHKFNVRHFSSGSAFFFSVSAVPFRCGLHSDSVSLTIIKPLSQKTQRHYRNPNKSTTSPSLPQIKENQSTQSEQARTKQWTQQQSQIVRETESECNISFSYCSLHPASRIPDHFSIHTSNLSKNS